ncbi:Trypsin Inhibitor like cysteine rich domain [Popillia japonica]|uniref:Trypsin Inhibitor like cysteine rich domain n=1 Tax=Popillia japonica TaxID=7064 RepID=A0AAW1HVN7_POPJA
MLKVSYLLLVLFAVIALAVSQTAPIVCNRPHEEYACGSACQTECKTLGETCPIVNIKCNDACYCVEGYARNDKGKCIPISECPPKPTSQIKPIKCNRPHEYYDCGSACQTECKTLGEPCPIVNIRCNNACYCVKGYARNDKGKCIPISKCPPKPSKY